MRKIILLSTFYFLLSVYFVFAQDTGGLVPCSGLDCTWCHLAELIGRVINFGLKLVIPIGVVFIAWGGLAILTAGGSSEKVKKGRDILTAAVIGIVISLLAWLFVTQFLNIITGNRMSLNPEAFDYQFCGE